MPAPCAACQALVEPGAVFCTACGQALGAAPAGPKVPGPEEERRHVTVLAVDLVGFSASAQTLDPEDLRAAQREFFSLVTAAVLDAGGTVAKRIGDAVVAVFGAPTAHENDAYRAVRAGLDVQAGLEGRVLTDGRPLTARVGVATGEALVTHEPGREEPRVAGQVLSQAMAVQDGAPPGGVAVSPHTHRATVGSVDYAPHTPQPSPGRPPPQDSWLAAYGRIPRSLRVGQHRRCAEWLDTFSPERGDDVAELRAHHRLTAYELAAVLGLDLEPYAHPARQALTTAAERALRLHAVAAAHGFARRSVMLWYGEGDTPAALRAGLLALELGFLDDPHAFYDEGGPARVQEAAEKLLAQGDRRAAAKAQVLLGQSEWYRGSGADVAAHHLSRAVDWLSEEPASEQYASALAELGRLRMLTHQYGEAITLSDRAMAIARPLRLLEVEANALITAGTARYSLGDPLGVLQQEEALRLSRQHGLRALQRAANNLAATMQEEGRLRRSYELIEESARATRGWGLSLTTRAHHSEVALMAWYDGDWNRLLEHTELFLADAGPEARQWESHLIAVASTVRTLRGEPVPPDLEEVVERGRRSGFPALVRSALAHLGGCRYLEGQVEEATRLFDELYEHTGQNIRGGAREWLYPAVLLGSFVGRPRLNKIVSRLEALEPKTPWLLAASHIAASHLLNDEGKHLDALERVQQAIDTYVAIGDQSSTAFARIRLARCAADAEDLLLVQEQNALVRQFIASNGAVRFEDFLPRPASRLRVRC